MAFVHAILLGIIEGLTEFLPVSSTGHLLVAEKLIGYKDVAEVFTVVIQVGAIAAVLWFYRQDLCDKVRKLIARDQATVRFWRNWVLATIPAGAIGVLLDNSLSKVSTLPVIAVALIIGGVCMWAIETYHTPKTAATKPKLEQLTLKQSLQVGCYQILSLIPGVSRSGATIMGGLLSGLDRVTATAFSFYLSMPILVLASGYKLVKNKDSLHLVDGGSVAILLGAITTFIVAFVVVKWLLRYVSKHDFKPFAYYRVALGLLILCILALR